jgi:hypothetical protein
MKSNINDWLEKIKKFNSEIDSWLNSNCNTDEDNQNNQSDKKNE